MSNSIPNIKSYEERIANFSWNIPREELEYSDDGVINIGEYCSDRICRMGKSDKIALIWEGFTGEEKDLPSMICVFLQTRLLTFLKT